MCGMTRARRIRWICAGVLMLVGGVGFGISIISGTWYFLQNGRAWGAPGYETYGTGPLGQFGVWTTVLSIAFAVVCIVQVVSAVLLILGRRAGWVLALVLVPLFLIFTIGFDLPFSYPGSAIALVLLLWPSGAALRSGSGGTR
jgi:hypothetical protein